MEEYISMEDFLKDLGINEIPNRSTNGDFVIDIKDSDDYGKFYSKLDKSNLVEENNESSQITSTVSSIQFDSDFYTLTLMSDFDNDIYKLTIREN